MHFISAIKNKGYHLKKLLDLDMTLGSLPRLHSKFPLVVSLRTVHLFYGTFFTSVPTRDEIAVGGLKCTHLVYDITLIDQSNYRKCIIFCTKIEH